MQRSVSIKAPPERIFPLISDFHQWLQLVALEQKDPAMNRAYGGAERGKGAVYAWDGDRMSVPAAWKFSKPPRRKRSSSSSISSRRSKAAAPPSSRCCRRAMEPSHMADAWSCTLGDQADPGVHKSGQHDRKGFRGRSRRPEDVIEE